MGEVKRMPIQLDTPVKKRNIYAQNTSDVKRLINSTINELRNGEIDSKTANAIGYLSNILLKVFESESVMSRLEEMDEQILLLQQQIGHRS
ncbi:hypothetical protein ACOALA_20300 [Alicyclobacillus acidoterrestris]|uniref:hypothetical protein n=1 Tax=Alicyclobacillus acidoterrestris TaxID=1450 RepID=UPI003F531328